MPKDERKDAGSVRWITREFRNCSRMERTPYQVRGFLKYLKAKPDSLAARMVDDPDLVMTYAREMQRYEGNSQEELDK